jgi:hypothetical protein
VQRTTNGLAIASLVISLSLFCLPLLAVVLGICALRQISRRGQSGRGLAVAGIVINGFATLLVALFVALGVAGAFDDGDTVVQDVKVGQCFDTVGGSALSDWADNVVRAPRVDVVPCRGEHDAEAFAVVPLGSEFGPGYPGQGALLQLATQECRAASDGYLGSVPYPDGMETYFSLPSRGVWNRGDHSVSCFYGSPDGQVAGSVLNGGGDQSGLGV